MGERIIPGDVWRGYWCYKAESPGESSGWKNTMWDFVTPKLKFIQSGAEWLLESGWSFSYWQETAEEIPHFSGIEVNCSFVTFYLGINPDKFVAHGDYLLNMLLAANTKAIIRNPPAMENWTAVVKELNCTEKWTFTMRQWYDQNVKYWKNIQHI